MKSFSESYRENLEKQKNGNWTRKDDIKAYLGLILIIVFVVLLFGSCTGCLNGGSSGKRCTICGSTSGLRHITNSVGDNAWYCSKHYADAWQYYYGK